ncbi:MAG: DNA mismatch repair protein MutS [Desulfobulbaceae bacterium A2]|nr:MAG: DNA mismatch repair protein MutS [Desulfobulbaceae bacterium A2]
MSDTVLPAAIKMTPMLQQYLELKESYPDAILFFRMGDFYEMFLDDARVAAPVLGVALTSRSHKTEAEKIPMCGVPHHALSMYLGRMLAAGYKVAICEQVEDPATAKGLVRREVVRVETPGVTTEENVLDARSNRYIAAVMPLREGRTACRYGLAFLDVSTGDFQVAERLEEGGRLEGVLDELCALTPAELLYPEEEAGALAALLEAAGRWLPGLCLSARGDTSFRFEQAYACLTGHFRTSNMAGFGCEELKAGLAAAGGLLAYIQDARRAGLPHVRALRPRVGEDRLVLDESTRRNLELTETIIGGRREGSLLSVLDQTTTPMGARLLRRRLLAPPRDPARIGRRLDAVEALVREGPARRGLREILGGIHDLERLCGRLVLGSGNARDLLALRQSLGRLPELRQSLAGVGAELARGIADELDHLPELHALLERAVREDAPVGLREGRLIREGYDAELDELIVLLRDGKRLVLELEARERERSGIARLKVGYNRVFGYYFELGRTQNVELPDYFIRKQTLANCERFITPELKELEQKILTAQDRRLELEYRIFLDLRQRVQDDSGAILHAAAQVARADFLASLAETAVCFRYVRPQIAVDGALVIREGRHPVIERALAGGGFVPNDVELNHDDKGLLIITGPNMAGKSTVLRQTALIVLMAHLGSFVPAEEARICIVDRIFTRVGAMDDLRRGQSTFMVEMNETANILNNATCNSLVVLDEIGRGTSTYDGLAIAWAVAEELAERDGRGIKTLFATHYHELTDLATTQPRISNYSIAVREWNDSIVFLHKLVEGAASRSYGIQVAGLAGVPEQVIVRAREILHNIEQGEFDREGSPRIGASRRRRPQARQPRQLMLFAPQEDPLRRRLEGLDPESLTPRAALELVFELCELLRRG